MTENDDICLFAKDGINRFNYRVAAFITCEGKILLHRPESIDFWTFIGGRVKFNEDSYSAMKREFKEELDFEEENFKIRRYCENFFERSNILTSEILIVYNLEINSNHPLFKNMKFEKIDDNQVVYFEWFDKTEIENLRCLPFWIYDMAKEEDWQFCKYVKKN